MAIKMWFADVDRLALSVCSFYLSSQVQAIVTSILAIIVGTAFRVQRNDCTEVQARANLLFVLTGFECVRSLSTRELFMTDRDQFLHEHTSGYYRVSPYFLGKLLGELVPKLLLPSIIFTVIVFSIAGVNTDAKGFFTMIFTIMMLACSASSLPLTLRVGENAAAVPSQLIVVYFVFMLALQHNEFLGQNFCPEHNTSEVSSRCQNYVIFLDACDTQAGNHGLEILANLLGENFTYYDWYHLMKAVLEPMVFLNWQAAYDDQMEVQACFNIQYNITVSHKMLMDQEPYVNPVTQAQIGQ
ncbi:hypothetical protein STEG23_003153 [Scotinomys teguina]